MEGKDKVFPAIQVNLFADIDAFIVSWDSLFEIDEEYEYYLEHRYDSKITETQLLRLFEWFNRGPLVGEQLATFTSDVAGRLGIINEVKETQEFIVMYEQMWDLKPVWFSFLMHLVGVGPIFDENIWRAYRYINTAEILEFPTDKEEQEIEYGDYSCFYWEKAEKLNYKYTDEMWDNALWMLGKFLKEYPGLFLS